MLRIAIIAGAATAPLRTMIAMVHRCEFSIVLIADAATAPLRTMIAMRPALATAHESDPYPNLSPCFDRQ